MFVSQKMFVEISFNLIFTDLALDGGMFLSVFGIIDCASLCLNTKNCSSFFYNHSLRSCRLSPERYQGTTGLAPRAGINYYSTIHVIPMQCKEEPSYENQGAVRKRKLSRPGHPVVIEYECDSSAEEKYKYFSGTKEAVCDDQGTWSLSTMVCIPTTCYTMVADSSGKLIAMYGGDAHKEKGGRECQAYNKDKPHKLQRRYRNFGACPGCGSVEDIGNKCRDITLRGIIGCFTVDTDLFRSTCDVPVCKRERNCARPPMVRGALALRKDLIGQEVHVTYRCHGDLKYLGGRNVSICDMKTGKWEWLDLLCASERCFYYGGLQWKTSIYIGNISTTESGRTCQQWRYKKPHDHTISARVIPGATSLAELGNVCRDPDSSGGPWCYTTDRNVKWEFCPVPECNLHP